MSVICAPELAESDEFAVATGVGLIVPSSGVLDPHDTATSDSAPTAPNSQGLAIRSTFIDIPRSLSGF